MARKLASQGRGLSEAQFREAYGSEEQCRAVVEKLRWPSGFVCPACGGWEGTRLGPRPQIPSRGCRPQGSLTAGTLFHRTKTPPARGVFALWGHAAAPNRVSPG